MLFGTWSQMHARDPSDCLETKLQKHVRKDALAILTAYMETRLDKKQTLERNSKNSIVSKLLHILSLISEMKGIIVHCLDAIHR